jgi:hypothetical protein
MLVGNCTYPVIPQHEFHVAHRQLQQLHYLWHLPNYFIKKLACKHASLYIVMKKHGKSNFGVILDKNNKVTVMLYAS